MFDINISFSYSTVQKNTIAVRLEGSYKVEYNHYHLHHQYSPMRTVILSI